MLTAATLLTIYHRMDSEWRSQSERGIRDGTLVDLYWYNLKHDYVCSDDFLTCYTFYINLFSPKALKN